ncbi:MAG TPA: hypothetical protein VFD92_20880 [Candidatus Binatia bacterium]|nr:hypothetical protein [Candidatus Binatia bacterium]
MRATTTWIAALLALVLTAGAPRSQRASAVGSDLRIADMGMGELGPELGGSQDDMIVDSPGHFVPRANDMIVGDPGHVPSDSDMTLNDPGRLPSQPDMMLNDPGQLPAQPNMDIEQPQDLDSSDDID